MYYMGYCLRTIVLLQIHNQLQKDKIGLLKSKVLYTAKIDLSYGELNMINGTLRTDEYCGIKMRIILMFPYYFQKYTSKNS